MRVQILFYTFLLFLILFLSNQTSPQNHIQTQKQDLIFQHYTTDQGLSASIVRCMIQDKIGYLWFGTYSGLDRYDGISFKSYKNIPGDTLSIINAFVQCLLEDKKGNLWIGTTNGLEKLDRMSETFTHYKPFNGSDANEWNNNIFSIYEDRFGHLWIGTGDGLNKFDPVTGSFTHFPNDRSDNYSLTNNLINVILEDKRGAIWIGTGNGLDKYDRETGSFIHYWQDTTYREGYYDGGVLNKYRINAIYENMDGTLWMGTQDGLLELNSDRDKFTLYKSDPKNSQSISFYATTSICEENAEALWIGTWNGLNLFNKITKKFTRIYHSNKVLTSLSHNSVSIVFREQSGTLWIATYGGGVNKVNRTSYPFKQYSKQNWRESKRFSSASIMNMSKALDGSIWLATPTGLLNFNPDKEIFQNYKITKNIRLVKEDRKGNLWIGINNSSGRGIIKFVKNGSIINITDSSNNKFPWLVNQIIEDNDNTLWACTEDKGGIIKINTLTNKFSIVYKSSITINTIYKDKTGLIWFGTRENGLLCLDPSNNKIINHFISDNYNPHSISGNSVMTIFEDEQGNLWLGTNMGLNKFDRNKNKFFHYTELNGLPHNWVYLIFEDAKKNLWLSTHKGMSKFNPLTQTFSNYDVLHGLMAADRAGVGCQSENGEIYLDSPGGLTRFHPDSIQDNPYIPPIVITSLMAADKTIPLTDNLELPFSSDHLEFEFAALSYVRPEKNLYAYKLEGLDDDWKFVGTIQSATYTNLGPGKYTFHVKGSNNDGIWNEVGASIKIIILPPWWRTGWAYFVYVLLILGIIYIIWKAQLRRIGIKQEFEMNRFEAKKLHEVDEIKSRFFTNISHEFRTPLTLILGPSRQLINELKDEKTKTKAELIHRSAKKLNRLVDELLDISKIESGEMKLKACPVNIISVVNDIARSFYSLAERKKIIFNLSSDVDKVVVYVDIKKIDKILTNVLSNAFKFTPEGGQIDVSVMRSFPFSSGNSHPELVSESANELKKLKQVQLDSNSFVEISIRDTGIGIPKDQKDKIFNRFYQVDGSHTREKEGTGIGLSLTKELVELHRGRIEVESEPGRGSIFTIIFLLGKDHLKSEEICEEKLEKDRVALSFDEIEDLRKENKSDIKIIDEPEKPSLLIVEDNSDVREYIIRILDHKYNILEAKDGEEGVSKSYKHIPDLIITDIMMPKMDGFQLCHKLKSDSRTSHIPIIMLTAKATLQDKLNGLETGADDYLMKPFEAEELKARIKNLLDQRKKLHEHFRMYGLPDIDEKNITSLDQKFLQKAIDIVSKHISDTSFGVEVLAEGLSVSRSLLLKKTEALFGESPNDLIRRVRLNKAARLIERNFGNISEIALEVGFSNPSYFAECFKKQFGVVPSQYYRKS